MLNKKTNVLKESLIQLKIYLKNKKERWKDKLLKNKLKMKKEQNQIQMNHKHILMDIS